MTDLTKHLIDTATAMNRALAADASDGPIREPGDDVPGWRDLYDPEELAAVVDLHAAKAAKRGDHGAYADLGYAADAIRALDKLASKR